MVQSQVPLPTASRVRLADQVVTILLDAILDGRFAVGSLLPAERELAAELDVNRTSLRQALARLEQMGVVEARQGRGTTVRDVSTATDPSLMAHLLTRDRRRVLIELFEVREAMAGLVGRLAAARASASDRRDLARALDEVLATDDAFERQAAELQFFRVLVTATRNRPLGAMQRWVDLAYGDAAELFVDAFDDPDPVTTGLRSILDAVARADSAGADAATTAYAAASAKRLLASARRQARRGVRPGSTA